MSQALKKAKALFIRKETVERAKSLFVPKESSDRTKSLVARDKTVESAEPLHAQKENVEESYESKLMICIEVLCTLVSNGPMKLSRLCDKFEMGETRLKPQLMLLWNRGLVEEEKFGGNETHYVVTERGLKVLKVIGPLLKEAHKIHMHDFEAVSNALSGAGYR